MAYAWEAASGWPPEIAAALAGIPELSELRPLWGFPEWKTPLPGGRRKSQTDLLVIASDGSTPAAFAVEGKVNETFGDPVGVWLGQPAAPGRRQRIEYLTRLLGVNVPQLEPIRYQLVHRTAAAKIEAARLGSKIAGMIVHTWTSQDEGWSDFLAFGTLLGIEPRPGNLIWSPVAEMWLGWINGDPTFLTY